MPPEPTPTLSEAEHAELDRLESLVDAGMQHFLTVGTSLLKIRDARLYRESHATFEGYCNDRWDLTSRRVNQLIAATEVMFNIDEGLGTAVPKPTSEWQVRPLSGLAPEEQVEAFAQAVQEAGGAPPTASQVADAVDVLKGNAKAVRDTGRRYTPPEIEPKSAEKIRAELGRSYLESLANRPIEPEVRERFDREALAFRHADAHLDPLRRLWLPELERPLGPFARKLAAVLRVPGPESWELCNCMTWVDDTIPTCVFCHGSGFVIPKSEASHAGRSDRG